MKIMQSLFLLFASVLALSSFGCVSASSDSFNTKNLAKSKILKIDMHLNALGVESDNFPSITASIDFTHHSSKCIKIYYNPAFKGSTYHLSSGEIMQILALLQETDFDKLKKRYRVSKTEPAYFYYHSLH